MFKTMKAGQQTIVYSKGAQGGYLVPVAVGRR